MDALGTAWAVTRTVAGAVWHLVWWTLRFWRLLLACAVLGNVLLILDHEVADRGETANDSGEFSTLEFTFRVSLQRLRPKGLIYVSGWGVMPPEVGQVPLAEIREAIFQIILEYVHKLLQAAPYVFFNACLQNH